MNCDDITAGSGYTLANPCGALGLCDLLSDTHWLAWKNEAEAWGAKLDAAIPRLQSLEAPEDQRADLISEILAWVVSTELYIETKSTWYAWRSKADVEKLANRVRDACGLLVRANDMLETYGGTPLVEPENIAPDESPADTTRALLWGALGLAGLIGLVAVITD